MKSLLELLNLIRQHESLWDKIKVLMRVPGLHFLDIDCHLVLPRQLIAAWKMIDFLIMGH